MVMPIDAFDHQSLFVTDTTVWKSDVVYGHRVEMAAAYSGGHLPVNSPLKSRYDLENRTSLGRNMFSGQKGQEVLTQRGNLASDETTVPPVFGQEVRDPAPSGAYKL